MKKQIYVLAIVLGIVSLNDKCKDDEPSPYVDIWAVVNLVGNPMKAGEVYPKIGETDLTKGAFSIDIQSAFKNNVKSISIDAIESIELDEFNTVIAAGACDAIAVELSSLEIPSSNFKMGAVSSSGCSTAAINAGVQPFLHKNFAPELKAGGKVAGRFRITALKDISNPKGAVVANVKFKVLPKASAK